MTANNPQYRRFESPLSAYSRLTPSAFMCRGTAMGNTWDRLSIGDFRRLETPGILIRLDETATQRAIIIAFFS